MAIKQRGSPAAALLQTIKGGLVTAAWLVTSTLTGSVCPGPDAAAAYGD
jgi:hypothetical protein